MKQKTKSKSKKVNVILVMSVVFFLISLFLKMNCPSNKPIQPFGITILNVMSDSMKPTFEKGDKIVVKKQKDYEVGDIITYIDNDKNLITHRIIEKYEDGFITKGDNNNTEDKEKVRKNQVLGKIIHFW